MNSKNSLTDALLKPRGSSRWIRIPTAIGDRLAIVSGLLIVVLMFITVSDAVLRKFFSSGVPGAVEVNEIVLVAIVFLALMLAETSGTNVRTPLVTARLPDRGANIAHLIGLVPALAFLLWATLVTGQEGIASTIRGDFRFGLIFVPTWPSKLIVPIGLAGLTVAILIKLVQAVRNLVKGLPANIPERENNL